MIGLDSDESSKKYEDEYFDQEEGYLDNEPEEGKVYTLCRVDQQMSEESSEVDQAEAQDQVMDGSFDDIGKL